MRAPIIAALLLTAFFGAAAAQPADSFYRGKQLTMIVGTDAGGGYDTYSRLLARHIGRHLPGQPSLVVQNMPGAGGMLAVNHLFGVANRDGTVFAMVPASNLLDGLLGNENAKFDVKAFTPIGNMNAENDNCLVWQGRGAATTADLFARDIVTGATGVSSNSYIYPALMNRIIATRFKLITGYPGTDRLRLLEKGELDAMCGVFTSTAIMQFRDVLGTDKVRILIQMGLSRHPNFSSVPLAVELAKTEEHRAILTLAFSPLEMGRPLLAPPLVPPDRARLLAAAFSAAMNDPALRAEAEKGNLELRWFGADRLAGIVAAMADAPETVKAQTKSLLSVR